MNAPREAEQEAGRWAEKAEHDLVNAEYVLTKPENCPFDTVCFHCQQCAEKYLKALLVARAVGFTKTHDLRQLLDLCRPFLGANLPPETVLPLNRYSVEGRYPGEWEEITRTESEQAVSAAKAVRAVVRFLLGYV